MKFNFSLDLAIIVSLLTVFFYACGQNYLAAYMGVFLIDPVVLNFSAADKINWGFLNCAEIISLFLIFFLIISYISYIASFFDIKTPFKFTLFKKKSKHIPPIHNTSMRHAKIASRIHNNFWILAITLIIFGSFISFALIDIRAKDSAKAVLENPYNLPKVRLKDALKNPALENDASKYTHHLIRCGINLCALIDEQKNVSLVEPKNVEYLSSNFAEKPDKNSL